MKIFFILFIFIFLQNCSFDNKTGIWNNSGSIEVADERFKDFKTLNNEKKSFNQIIEPVDNFKPNLEKILINFKWNDEFYNDSNNSKNFSYDGFNKIVYKSKRLSKYAVNKKILFQDNHVIIADVRGNITVYSITDKEIVFRFNFYKKKIKKNKKILSLIIENEIIYVADNLGYLYAINFIEKKIIWAQNYKIPFRSNLKIFKNKLILANQDNSLFIINKLDGVKKKTIPTEELMLKNNFINSLAKYGENIFFLNTFGSLYSINATNNNFNWFINLNTFLDSSVNNFFNSNPLVINKDYIFIATNPYLYVLNKTNGLTKIRMLTTSTVKPIASADQLFFINENTLLVSLDIGSGKVNFSLDINKKVSNFLKTKNKKTITVKSFSLVNNNLLLFLDNSYIVEFNLKGKILKIDKLPSKLNSLPIFIDNSILYLDNKNKLTILN